MVVHIAGIDEASFAIYSQVFTLSYFIGLFGFPYIAGQVVKVSNFDCLLISMIIFIAANGVLLAIQMFSTIRKH